MTFLFLHNKWLNSYKLNGLKQHKFIIFQFPRLQLSWILCSVSWDWNQSAGQTVFSSGVSTRERFAFKLPQKVCRMHFWMLVGLKSPLSFCLAVFLDLLSASIPFWFHMVPATDPLTLLISLPSGGESPDLFRCASDWIRSIQISPFGWLWN